MNPSAPTSPWRGPLESARTRPADTIAVRALSLARVAPSEDRTVRGREGFHAARVFRKRLCGNRPEIRSKHDPCAHGPSSFCGLSAAHVSSVAGDRPSAYATDDVPRWSADGGGAA